MAHEVGQVLAGDELEQNAQTWRDFLLRPENLSTALVLAAGIASPRQRGQSKLSKGLQAGVGALGFRGGLEKGKREQKRTAAEDTRAAAESAAEITRGQEQSAQAREANRLSAEQIRQQGEARPITESERKRNEAQASAFKGSAALDQARADLFGREVEQAGTFATLLTQALQNQAVTGTPVDLTALASQAASIDLIERFRKEGKILPSGEFDLTDEEQAELVSQGFNLPAIAPPKEDGDEEDGGAPGPKVEPKPKDFESILEEVRGERERIEARPGRVSASGFAKQKSKSNVISKLKTKGRFRDASDDSIEQALAGVIASIRSGAISTASIEDLREMTIVFGSVLSRDDQRVLRLELSRKARGQ